MLLSPTAPSFTMTTVGYVSSCSGASDTDSTSGSGSTPLIDLATSPGVLSGTASPDPEPVVLVYEFEIHQDIVGLLIGKRGGFINQLKIKTGANIYIKMHYFNPVMKICCIEGTKDEVERVLYIVRGRFPLNNFPTFCYAPITFLGPHPPEYFGFLPISTGTPLMPPPLIPATTKLSLVEGVINDVRLSCYRSVTDMSFQQPTHPTFPSLAKLQELLTGFYNACDDAPGLATPFNPGVICVAPLPDSSEWVRVEVVRTSDQNAVIRRVDNGGHTEVPISNLRQIRCDFLAVPFQSTDCKLYGIEPRRDIECEALESYFGKFFRQILQAHVVGYHKDGTPLIQLYRTDDNQVPVLINEELVSMGLAQYERKRSSHSSTF